MARGTLLEVLIRNSGDREVGLIEEAIKATPEVSGFDVEYGRQLPGVSEAKSIRGLDYRTKVRVGLPIAGFRHANEGVTAGVSRYENRLVQTFILSGRIEVDKAVADRDEDGPESYMADEGLGVLQAGFLQAAKSFYYGKGTGGDAKGHPGLLQAYDATNMMVDAGGTTDDEASSVWLVRFDVQGVRWVVGSNGQLEVSDPRVETIYDADDKPLPGYVSDLTAYLGVQVGSTRDVCRIKKLTTDSGKGLTDALLYAALAKFPAGKRPTVVFMTQRSRAQLRTSRTATNATGAPAPIPQDIEGIPIVVTEALSDTEKLTL